MPRAASALALTAAGRRSHVTVLFADVSGSSEHAERLDPEVYAALLERFRQFARGAVATHGGQVARLQGDGVLALFGVDGADEADGRRAIEAALDLHAAVATLRAGEGPTATQLQMHSGLHAGLVLLVPGDIERGRLDVVGEVPNTAARLCTLAGPGEIVVSAETLGPHARFFDVAPPRQVTVRGRSETLSVLRVRGRGLHPETLLDGQPGRLHRSLDAADRRGVARLVGRADVLQTLRAAADTVAAGGGARRWLVCGEPGIGKSRLLAALRQALQAAGWRCLVGTCEGYGGIQPLQPLQQALAGARLNAAQTHAPAQAQAQALEMPANARDLAQALADLARPAAGRGPLLLVLDDWQWADDASRSALQQLLETVQADAAIGAPTHATHATHATAATAVGTHTATPWPLLVVLGARSGQGEEDSIPAAARLALAPLAEDDALALVQAWLPSADPFLVQAIAARGGGSPLFLEELCHAAAAGDGLPALPARGGTAWLEALVGSRMARLPEVLAQALQLAAVLGNTLVRDTFTLLMDAPDAAEAARRADALCAQGLLLPDDAHPGQLRFPHGLTREAVYATLNLGPRRLLHLRVAETLEAAALDDPAAASAEALATHYAAAGVLLPAARHAETAGDAALNLMALDRARAHFLTALQALDALPALPPALMQRWCGLVQKLGMACVFDPLDLAQGLRFLDRAVQMAQQLGDANAQARAEYWRCYLNYARGRPRASVRHGRAALAQAEACGDIRLTAQVRATLGQALAAAGTYVEALPLLREAVVHKRAQARPGSGVAIGSAYTLGRTGYTLADLGQFDAAQAAFDESLALIGGQTHSVAASVHELVAVARLWAGQWDQAQASALHGAQIALRCRSHYLVAMGRALAACGAWAAADAASDSAAADAARDTLRANTERIDALGGGASTSLNHGWLVQACARAQTQAEAAGDDAAAAAHGQALRTHHARLLQRARLGDRHGLAQGLRALALQAAHRGDMRRCQRHLAAAARASAARGSPREAALDEAARVQALTLLAARQIVQAGARAQGGPGQQSA